MKKEYGLKILTHFDYQHRKEGKMFVEVNAQELLLILAIVLSLKVL